MSLVEKYRRMILPSTIPHHMKVASLKVASSVHNISNKTLNILESISDNDLVYSHINYLLLSDVKQCGRDTFYSPWKSIVGLSAYWKFF